MFSRSMYSNLLKQFCVTFYISFYLTQKKIITPLGVVGAKCPFKATSATRQSVMLPSL